MPIVLLSTSPEKRSFIKHCIRAVPTALLAALCLTSPAAAQSFSSQPAPPQQSSGSSQSQPATPDPAAQKEDSVADAARKSKDGKSSSAKPAKQKVYTEDDLAGMKNTGVSVVGDPSKKTARRAQPINPDDNSNDEEYWRGRAQQILDAIAQTDEQIAQKKEEIKKLGSGGFDVTTGLKSNVAYINDRNGQLKALEDRKLQLQKQLDDLAEEGRKAGAPAAWFR